MRSPIYWHRGIYRNTYGRSHPDFEGRYKLVAGLIEPGSSVLDVCCGDGRLFTHYLQDKNCSYRGIDLSLGMVPQETRAYCLEGNAIEAELPVSDYVVMMESLYHFCDRAGELLERLLASARKKVILIEQVQNRITLLPKWLNHFLSNPGNGSGDFRFSRAELEDLVRRADPSAEITSVIKGYDLLIVMSGRAGEEGQGDKQ